MSNGNTLLEEKKSLNFIIQVKRQVLPVYPPWKKRLLHPELETAGFPVYYLTMLRPWLHEKQKMGTVKGQVIYDHLRETGIISTCLNLQDGYAIVENGLEPILDVFGEQALFLWASVAESKNGQFSVPYIYKRHYQHKSEPDIAWHWLDDVWCKTEPALRFNNLEFA
jgi:hypothetical protein